MQLGRYEYLPEINMAEKYVGNVTSGRLQSGKCLC